MNRSLAIAEALRDRLQLGVKGAREGRNVLSALDPDALLAWAADRHAFQLDAERLRDALATALSEAAGRLGLETCSVEAFRTVAPDEAAALEARISEIAALAEALRELDELNLHLGARAQTFVGGWLEAFSPSATYDRSGRSQGDGRGSTTSRHA